MAQTPALWGLRFRGAKLLEVMTAAPSGFAAADLADIIQQMSAPAGGPRYPLGGQGAAVILVSGASGNHGSPKTSSPSTSSVLGSYLLERLGDFGWETESLTLRANLNREEGEAALLDAVDRAGVILLVFPLYADALPFLATKALTVIADHRRASGLPTPQRLMALVNSGFPETRQNAMALAICQEFACQTGMRWSGGLALAGGGMVGTRPLTEPERSGPPVKNVIEALDLTAEALAEGRPVPAQAVNLMTKNPFPWMPFGIYRWIYARFGGKGFEKEAAKNGVSRERMLDQPYAA